jgi:hypothetical protein
VLRTDLVIVPTTFVSFLWFHVREREKENLGTHRRR